MKCVVVLLIAIHAIICSGLVHHTNAYGPVYGYGVPVQSQPLVYTSPQYHGSYVGPYAYSSPAVSHSYSHTQTHPVAYVKPVTTYFGPSSSYYAPAYGPAAYTSSAYTSGQYYTPASSNVEHTRFVVPQTNRNFRYQTNQQYNSPESRDGSAQQQQFGDQNRGAQKPAQTIHIHIQQPNSPYTQSSGGQSQGQFNRQNQFNRPNQFNRNGLGAGNRNVYADRMPYTNNGEQVKLRRYRVHRPGIQKEFYDVEERVIVRPAGSALIELDTPTKKQDITDYQPNGGKNFNSNQQRQFNQKGYQPNGNQQSFNAGGDDQNDENQQYFAQPEYDQTAPIYRVPDCGGYGDDDEQTPVTPVNEYGPPVVTGGGGGFGNRQTPQYHPTTFTPPTNRFPTNNYPTSGYPTTVVPLTPRPTYYPTYYPTTTVQGSYPTTTGQGSYPTTTVQGSYPTTTGQGSYPTTTVQGTYPTTVQGSYYPRTTPSQYPTTPGNTFHRTKQPGQTKTSGPSTPGQQSDIYISSTTPVSVTIVDKNENATTKGGSQDRDIIYGSPDHGQYEENTPDQVQNELPPRGDLSQYQTEQSDQFYHELPRSRYTNGPNRQPQAFNVYSRSRGEPTEAPFNPQENQENADLVEIDEKKDRNFSNNRNRPSSEQQKQGRLIELYTGGNGGVSEIAQPEDQNTNSRYTSGSDGNKNGQYQDAGNVRARVIAVTPAPATFTPTETVNHRRIVVAKPVELVQEVVEPDNSTTNGQRGNYRSNYADGRGNQGNQNYDNNNQNNKYQNENDFESNNDSGRYNNFNGESERYQNDNGNDNEKFNGNDDFNRNGDYQNENSEYTGQYRNGNSNFDQNSNQNGKYQNDNSDFDQNANYNGQYRNGNSNFDQNSNSNGQYQNENVNFNRNSNQKGEYRNPSQFSNSDVNYARNSNDQKSKNANYEDSVSSSTPAGVFISTTPSSASQRIIYVQPVSQEFAAQKAVPPKKQ